MIGCYLDFKIVYENSIVTMWNIHVLKEEENVMDFLQLLKYVYRERGK